MQWWFILIIVYAGCSGLAIITDGQFHVFNEGDSVNLECSFRSDRYNMFDYPVIWRKQQMAEETQMNVMGSLNEPFVSSNRFEVTFTSVVPVYLVELSILGKQPTSPAETLRCKFDSCSHSTDRGEDGPHFSTPTKQQSSTCGDISIGHLCLDFCYSP